MLFIENKYTRIYYAIIDNAANVKIRFKTQHHHIIPTSMGGSDDKDNKVHLTHKEHFVCHRLLTKMTEGKARRSMIKAANRMLTGRANQHRYMPVGSVVQKLKEDAARINPFYDPAWRKENAEKRRGTKMSKQGVQNIRDAWTDDRRALIGRQTSERMKGNIPWNLGKVCPQLAGENNGFYNKKHSVKSLTKMRMPRKGPQCLITCPHCGIEGGQGNMKRYHFNNCKVKK